MESLTKDDLEYLDRIGAWTHRGLKGKILNNQEKAEKWDEATTVKGYEEFLENKDIVERLKKQIEFIKNLNYKEDGHTKRVLELLQKILGGELDGKIKVVKENWFSREKK